VHKKKNVPLADFQVAQNHTNNIKHMYTVILCIF